MLDFPAIFDDIRFLRGELTDLLIQREFGFSGGHLLKFSTFRFPHQSTWDWLRVSPCCIVFAAFRKTISYRKTLHPTPHSCGSRILLRNKASKITPKSPCCSLQSSPDQLTMASEHTGLLKAGAQPGAGTFGVPEGLTTAEALVRLKDEGTNTLEPPPKEGAELVRMIDPC
jgi:hypothetical protein